MNVIFSTGHDSVKAKHMLRDSRVSLYVNDQTPPFSFVIIDGIVKIDQEPELNELLRWTAKIAGRYTRKLMQKITEGKMLSRMNF